MWSPWALHHPMHEFRCGSCNKLGWPEELQTTEINSLTVLGARSPKARCRKGHAPSEGSRGDPFLTLLSAWRPRHSLAGGPIVLTSASISTWDSASASSPCLCWFSLCFPLEGHLSLQLGRTLNPESSLLEILHLITSTQDFS